jgi:hypothetical protein
VCDEHRLRAGQRRGMIRSRQLSRMPAPFLSRRAALPQ